MKIKYTNTYAIELLTTCRSRTKKWCHPKKKKFSKQYQGATLILFDECNIYYNLLKKRLKSNSMDSNECSSNSTV